MYTVLWLRFFLTWLRFFFTLTEVLPCFFLSFKANARVKLAKTGHGPHSTALVCTCVVRMFIFVLFCCYLCCSMYCLCVNVYCHRVTTQLQLINKYKYIYTVKYIYHLRLASSKWFLFLRFSHQNRVYISRLSPPHVPQEPPLLITPYSTWSL
jgi:hypothetical protein